ncbi:hypothetical protein WCD74_17430 [Actinomycetospora sp. OC33-EN08]|uniref:Basic proline-rich protein n=1 Tax=Actinomycetospora aurantiaca TaxID=3129233 RepID=A0ABU8MQY5_9PSEU
MAEAVPHPDGPRPEPRAPEAADAAGRPARARGGRDPVALAAWRRVAEQRRRASGAETPVEEPHGAGPDGTPADDRPAGTPEPGSPDVPTPAAGLPVGDPTPATGLPAAPTAPEAVEVPDAVERDAVEPEAVERVEPEEPGEPPAAPSRPDAPVVRDRETQRPGRPGGAPHPGAPRSDDDRDQGPTGPDRLHDVLLGLAGRIDDDALTTVREMVAAEDDAEAAELLGGCLLADEVGLGADERAVLAPWFASGRVDPDLLAALPVDPDARRRSGHRFTTTAGAVEPAASLARAARRLPGVVTVRESWRVTPAGVAPGPVPHRVVLVETADPDDCDHVVHHLAHAARGLGSTSIEVYASGVALPAYHRDALAAARPLTAAEERPAPARSEDDETWRTVADAGTAHEAPRPLGDRPPEPEPGPPAVGKAGPDDERAAAPAASTPPTSIDDDLSVTARRIAALWARPVPEDFSAPLPADSLEETRLEPPLDAGTDADDPAPDDLVPDELQDELPDDVGPGRHGRPATGSFPAPTPTRRNGHHLGDAAVDDEAGELVDAGEPTPPEGTPADDPQVQRARHSRGPSPEEPTAPARFGHDARFGAGPGPAWPGAPVTGAQPGADTVFASPVEVGGEAVTLGTNGHRHEPVRAVAPQEPEVPEEPATGPVSWAEPSPEPFDGAHLGDAPGTATDVAPPWAAADGAGWTPETAAWAPPRPAPAPGPDAAGTGPVHQAPPPHAVPPRPGPPGAHPGPPPQGPPHLGPAAGGPPRSHPPDAAPPVWPADPEATSSWAPDTDDSVAQLSERERELLARLHEELAQRERAEGSDPFGGPAHRGRPRPGEHPPDGHGRVNGHGLPGGRDDTH